MDYEAFLGCLTLLADATNKYLSDGLIEQWSRTFGLYPLETVATAVDLAAAECEFFPTLAAFGAILAPLLTPEEREVQDGIRSLRGWMSRGVVPVGLRDPAELAAVKAALGLPPPTQAEVAKLAERAGLLGDEDAGLMPGPVVARLLGVDRPALVRGGR